MTAASEARTPKASRESMLAECKTDAGRRLLAELQECPQPHLGELVFEIEREAAAAAETALDIRPSLAALSMRREGHEKVR